MGLWIVAGVVGSVLFWLIQVLTGGPTITAFMGEQIVATGEYPEGLTTLIGWAVHLGVGLGYAFLFGAVVLVLGLASFAVLATVSFIVALGLGWVTSLIAPPAITVTISLLGGLGWPAELASLNTEIGLPFWNHILFFLLNWVVQALGPRGLGQA